MMKCDAEWLNGVLAKFSVDELSPVLNLGSSTLAFRTTEQPYIQELIVAPLEARGVRIVHTDLKHAPGVDIAGDIFDHADFARLKAVGARSIICTHMFEHVVDRADLRRRILDLLPDNGLFFVTVPASYPEHNDPIDTLFRPTPAELAAVFAGQQILETADLEGHNYWTQVRRRPLTVITRHVTRFFIPFVDWHAWKRSMSKLYWLVYPYRVSSLVGRKTAART
jgi:hypothetical protein